MNRRELELQQELAKLQEGSAKVVHALDSALQLVEALIAFLPEGTALPEGVATAKHALDRAMRELKR
jgi:hypothetical protein